MNVEEQQQQYFTQNNIKKENNSSIYSIKLRSISLNKLLNKFYPQKELQEEGELQQEIQSERSVDCSTANASTPTTQIDVEHTQNEGGNAQQSDSMVLFFNSLKFKNWDWVCLKFYLIGIVIFHNIYFVRH